MCGNEQDLAQMSYFPVALAFYIIVIRGCQNLDAGFSFD